MGRSVSLLGSRLKSGIMAAFLGSVVMCYAILTARANRDLDRYQRARIVTAGTVRQGDNVRLRVPVTVIRSKSRTRSWRTATYAVTVRLPDGDEIDLHFNRTYDTLSVSPNDPAYVEYWGDGDRPTGLVVSRVLYGTDQLPRDLGAFRPIMMACGLGFLFYLAGALGWAGRR